ncbi:S8 family serine peptidase, partial [Microcoleus sp. B9-D4]|uniref:S8 family serine peptidase n=1 Tax=Microcoleus sp. B9-D4 TaxID=2818711 RepID=UPI002FD3FB96
MTDTSELLKDLKKEPLFQEQWWLFNTGQRVENNIGTAGTPGIDLNVLPLWPFYTGKGVKVGVIDNGIDKDHPDLKDKFKEASESDIEKILPNYAGDHGTAATGIILAGRNNLGTVGIAYDATFGGYRYKDARNSLEAQAKFDVSNNSWGGSLHFETSSGYYTIDKVPGNEIEDAAKKGRNTLGTVFVWAGGNERQDVNPALTGAAQRGRNVNSGNDENSRYVIAVAAIDNKGVVAPYSNPGAPLLVSAFGDRPDSIATVDRTGENGYNTKNKPNFEDTNYTNEFSGTSAAAPMVSGVAALILQANPKLGYRDVQEILAYSARKNDPNNDKADQIIGKDTWTFNGAKNWNGGGLHVNHDYGFGLVDATAAVRLAETWQFRSGTAKDEAATLATESKDRIFDAGLTTPLAIPNNNGENLEVTFKVGKDKDINIDKLELDLNIEHGQFQDLVVKLISPDGTESVMLDRVPYYTGSIPEPGQVSNKVIDNVSYRIVDVGRDKTNSNKGFQGTTVNYTFSSARHWGETGLGNKGIGNWKLIISDNSDKNDTENTGQANIYRDENSRDYRTNNDKQEEIPLKVGADPTDAEKKSPTKTSGNNIGVLKGATLRLYGDELIDDNTYIYTNEFANFTNDADQKEALRKTLSDTNDGNDIINVAAITDNVIIDLAPKGESSLPGRTVTGKKLVAQTLTIADGSIIENAFAGAGDDSIVGNDAANTLWGGRGNDTLVASGSGDTLIGFSFDGDDTLIPGSDSLVGSTGDTTYILDAKTAGGSRIKNVGGVANKLILNATLTTTLPAEGQNGMDKIGNNLLIDLNADGKLEVNDDLTIEDFFLPGSGTFPNVGNLLGSDILQVFTPTTPTPTTPTPTTPTPTTPTPTTPTPTTPTPTTPTPTSPTPT